MRDVSTGCFLLQNTGTHKLAPISAPDVPALTYGELPQRNPIREIDMGQITSESTDIDDPSVRSTRTRPFPNVS